MKKRIMLLCMLFVLAGLAGCGEKTDKTAEASAEQEASQAEQKQEKTGNASVFGNEAEETGSAENTEGTDEEESRVGTGFVPKAGSHVDSNGNIVAPNGDTTNTRGQWQIPEGGRVDSQGRIYDKNGKMMGGGATVGSVG